MATLKVPVTCCSVPAKHAGVGTVPRYGVLFKSTLLRSSFWGFKAVGNDRPEASHLPRVQKLKATQCSFNSSSDGNDSMSEHFNVSHEDYVNSTVLEAVEVKSGVDGFVIRMRDGKYIRCVHNNPQGGHMADYAPHPAIVLKMNDGANLLLPIIVSETPSVLLMAALRNVQIARPTLYQVLQEMIDKMGYAVKLVRVTKRVHDAYFAQLYLTKVDNEAEHICLDLRPSDAINIAVRCQVPIQVNKYLAQSDGMRIVEPARVSNRALASDGLLFTELDRPNGHPCAESTEFNLLRDMLVAAVEERYKDAAEYRDKLTELRSKRNWV